MNLFFVFTVLFIIVSIAMILIILVQRAQGGGLAGAFGGAGGGGTDTVFGGRVGDALTWATVVAFVLYLIFAVALNRTSVVSSPAATPAAETETIESTGDGLDAAPLDPGAGEPAAPTVTPITPEPVPAPTFTPPAGGEGDASGGDASGETGGDGGNEGESQQR